MIVAVSYRRIYYVWVFQRVLFLRVRGMFITQKCMAPSPHQTNIFSEVILFVFLIPSRFQSRKLFSYNSKAAGPKCIYYAVLSGTCTCRLLKAATASMWRVCSCSCSRRFCTSTSSRCPYRCTRLWSSLAWRCRSGFLVAEEKIYL